MRQVVLDTETTGLSTADGHRIIEIGCVEMVNRRLTANRFHRYINPDRAIDAGAVEVHGITNEMLADKPAFADLAEDFLAFIDGSELIIHNAPFDVGFINYELGLLEPTRGKVADLCSVLDTLKMARFEHPGQRNTLDALCRRYDIDNSKRELHGALLDAELLADVYLAMTGGQATLLLGDEKSKPGTGGVNNKIRLPSDRAPLKVVRADEEAVVAHEEFLQAINKASDGNCLWLERPEF